MLAYAVAYEISLSLIASFVLTVHFQSVTYDLELIKLLFTISKLSRL